MRIFKCFWLLSVIIFSLFKVCKAQQPEEDSISKSYKKSFFYFNNQMYDSAIHHFSILNKYYAGINNAKAEASTLNYLGIAFHKTGNLDSALSYYLKSLKEYELLNDDYNASYPKLNLGMIYKERGDYELSLENLLAAARMFAINQDSITLAACYNSVANVYLRQRDFESALDYHFKALNIRKVLTNQYKEVSSSFNNIGLVFQALDEPDSAIHYFKLSLDLKRKHSLESSKSTLNNLGIILLDLKKPLEAKGYLLEARKINSATNDESLAVTFNGLGYLYSQLGQYEKAVIYFDSATQIINDQKLIELKKDNLHYRMLLYEKSSPSKALEYAKELMVINDSIYNINRTKALIEMKTKYETEKKEQSIALLEQERNLQTVEIKVNRLWMLVLAVSVALVLILALLIFTRLRLVNKSKRKIQTLMQELHHRVKNNLQLLSSIFSLQSRMIKDENALEAVKSGENRVNAMAIIHQKLYTENNARSINARGYFDDLLEELANSYGYNIEDQNIVINIENFDIDVDRIIPIGLIVNELVSNVFKYSFPVIEAPTLSVTITTRAKVCLMEIKDNGPGFSKNENNEQSMGLNIIETLGRQLGANMKWETTGYVQFNMELNLKD